MYQLTDSEKERGFRIVKLEEKIEDARKVLAGMRMHLHPDLMDPPMPGFEREIAPSISEQEKMLADLLVHKLRLEAKIQLEAMLPKLVEIMTKISYETRPPMNA